MNIKKLFQYSIKKSIEQQAYYDLRLKSHGHHPYPPFKPTKTISQFLAAYHQLLTDAPSIEKVIGRVSAIRTHGKTTFIDIRQEHQKLQIATTNANEIRRGDIIGVEGNAFLTKKGQLSLNAQTITMVSPCLWMLPQHQGLKDPQQRYRNKHIDLISNKESMEVLKKRSVIISSLRRFLQSQGYMQVQTPTLSVSYGGALAKPFTTYHNDHKMNLFMRIAPQLYLKQLIIGGLTKVYEIGKNFRNQSIDQTHNPQFTSCQFYCGYANYQQMIKFTHQLINHVAMEVNGTTIINSSQPIDLAKEWKEIDFMQELQRILHLQLPITFNEPETLAFYDNLCKQKQIQCEQPRTIQRLLDKLCQKYLEGGEEPLIIKNHPRVMSPLAKQIPQRPHLTQRFQLFIRGWQLVNCYTELNNPHIQRVNTPSQTDYVEAMEYGMMPCAGWGMGIDRLVMLLTHRQRIQQVLGFPLLKQ